MRNKLTLFIILPLKFGTKMTKSVNIYWFIGRSVAFGTKNNLCSCTHRTHLKYTKEECGVVGTLWILRKFFFCGVFASFFFTLLNGLRIILVFQHQQLQIYGQQKVSVCLPNYSNSYYFRFLPMEPLLALDNYISRSEILFGDICTIEIKSRVYGLIYYSCTLNDTLNINLIKWCHTYNGIVH
jgi:hypothetical protein